MAHEFWGPSLPPRRSGPAQKLKRIEPETKSLPTDPDLSPPARPAESLESPPNSILTHWAQSRRREVESRVELDIWARIKDRLDD